jgi:hypothetical protein
MKIIIDGTPQELKEFLSCIPRDNTPPQRVEKPELRKLAETLAGGIRKCCEKEQRDGTIY